jgi:hypothetical protein
VGFRDEYRSIRAAQIRAAQQLGQPVSMNDLKWLNEYRAGAPARARAAADAAEVVASWPGPSSAARAAAPAGPAGQPAAATRRPARVRTWEDAERMAAGHMRTVGFPDAEVTTSGPDGGVDVKAAAAVGQVKHWTGKVGAREVRDLNGAAAALGVQGLFYALSGYTAEAVRWAEQAGLALFVYDTDRLVRPVTAAAGRLSGEKVVTRLAPPPETAEQRRAAAWQTPLPRGMREPRARPPAPRPGEGTWRGGTLDADQKTASRAVERAAARVAKRTQSSLAGRRAKATAAEALIAAAQRELVRSSRLAANDKRRKDHHKAARAFAARAEKVL